MAIKKKKKYRFNKAQEKWLQALESGKYRKGRGSLKTRRGGYCCLGVAVMEVGEGDRLKGGLQQTLTGEFAEVRRALRLLDEEGLIAKAVEGDQFCFRSLALLNDDGNGGRPWTHQQIAAFIRANPERVFFDG